MAVIVSSVSSLLSKSSIVGIRESVRAGRDQASADGNPASRRRGGSAKGGSHGLKEGGGNCDGIVKPLF